MSKKPEAKKREPGKVSSAAGFTSGTVVIAIAKHMDKGVLQDVLIHLSPAVTVLTSLFIFWFMSGIHEKWDRQKATERAARFESDLSKAITVAEELLRTPDMPDERKKAVQERLFSLREQRLAYYEGIVADSSKAESPDLRKAFPLPEVSSATT